MLSQVRRGSVDSVGQIAKAEDKIRQTGQTDKRRKERRIREASMKARNPFR